MIPIKAWHFSDGDQLRYGDSRRIVAGETITHDGPIVLCTSGLHASRNILDALSHAPGNTVWRVECTGRVIEGDDKLVCTGRTALWGLDAETLLRRFARRCALDVIHLWNAPKIVVRYLVTGDDQLRAAAWAAAWAAARAAAVATAWERQTARLASMIHAEHRRTG